ncbi:glycoprotein-N-acetylgalactosamine 3-beta-galactosyltransferase 1-B [Asbolus verrucosus]|uniref:Glycoprotein-N-acetylgalactosamine 3-beta-galactosyltransferase 1-B n=1 Tax=Asbolus verrucosus TaxID=1661398 RepID=A0A482W874_ASBVE|nr:glycoprotein-N-acetylgalactosamine 3-beta-galactosyltransferase 1-B [Asbolus verrucosus]
MFRIVRKLSFIIGIFIGVFLAVLLKINNRTVKKEIDHVRRPFQLQYNKWFKKTGLIRQPLLFDSLRYGNGTYFLESNFLFNEVNVFCLILVKTAENAQAAEQTWAKHCNKIHLLNVIIERKRVPILKRHKEKSSWVLLCDTLKKVPEEHEWILIVYDYTFVLLENLRLFLASLNPEHKYYLGHAVKFWSTIYNMGQAGYVLSRGSLNIFKQKFKSTDSCTKTLTYMNLEDYYLGKNLAALNILPADTRDANDLSTFHPYNLQHVFFPGQNFYKYSMYPHKCCSPYSVAFQSVDSSKMYTYYYLLYRLQLFHGGHLGNRPAYKSFADEEIWKNFLRSHNIPLNITEEQYYNIWREIANDPMLFSQQLKGEDCLDYVE